MSREYIYKVKLGTFTPLVFAVSGGMAKSITVVHTWLTSFLVAKCDQPHNIASYSLASLSYMISHDMPKSSQIKNRESHSENMHLAVCEGQVTP